MGQHQHGTELTPPPLGRLGTAAFTPQGAVTRKRAEPGGCETGGPAPYVIGVRRARRGHVPVFTWSRRVAAGGEGSRAVPRAVGLPRPATSGVPTRPPRAGRASLGMSVPAKRCGRPPVLSFLEKKKRKQSLDRRRGKTRIYVGNHIDRWLTLKEKLDFRNDAEVAGFLLDL